MKLKTRVFIKKENIHLKVGEVRSFRLKRKNKNFMDNKNLAGSQHYFLDRFLNCCIFGGICKSKRCTLQGTRARAKLAVLAGETDEHD